MSSTFAEAFQEAVTRTDDPPESVITAIHLEHARQVRAQERAQAAAKAKAEERDRKLREAEEQAIDAAMETRLRSEAAKRMDAAIAEMTVIVDAAGTVLIADLL